MEKKSRAKKNREDKPNQVVSLKLFSQREQALITLAADNKNQTITEFMVEGIRFFIKEMVEIRFKTDEQTLDL